MIRIEVGREVLDLFSETKMEWIRVNPLFVEEVDFAADFTYNFTIPRSGQNARILRGKAVFMGSRIYVNGQLFARCVLHKLRSDDDTIEISCVADMGQAKETMIQEMDLPEWEFSWALVDDANAGKMPFVFPWVRTEDEETNRRWLDQAATQSQPFCVNQRLTHNILTNVRLDILSPFFNLQYAIDKIIAELTNFQTIHNHEIEDNTVIFNNYLLNKYKSNIFTIFYRFNRELTQPNVIPYEEDVIRLVFPKQGTFDDNKPNILIFQRGFKLDIGEVLTFPVGYFVSGSFTKKTIEYTVQAADISGTGQMDWAIFLDNIRGEVWAETGVIAPFNIVNGERYATLDLTLFTDLPEYNRGWTFSVRNANVFIYENIKLKNHLPKMDSFDFLQIVKNFFNITFVPNYMNDTVYVLGKSKLLNSNEYKDYSAKLLSERIEFHETEKSLKVKFQKDSKDLFNKEVLVDYTPKGYIFDDKIEINLAANNVLNSGRNQQNATTINEIDIIHVNQPFESIEIKENEFLLRFAQYQGEKSLTNAETIYSADGRNLEPDIIFKKLWRPWVDSFLTGREIITFTMQLNANDIQGLNPELKWMINQEMFLWKEIRTPITMQHGIEPSEVKLVKVNYSVGCDTGILQIEEIENEEEGE